MTDEPIQQPAQEPASETVSETTAEPTGGSDANARVVEEDERYRGATPPGYDWPTHGGYLGCLLGVMIACVLAPLGYILFGFVGAFLVHPLGGFGFALSILITVGVYMAVFIALSRLGWSMGKRFLREYEQPVRPVWGEDDEEDYPLVVEADPPTSQSAGQSAASEAQSQRSETAG